MLAGALARALAMSALFQIWRDSDSVPGRQDRYSGHDFLPLARLHLSKVTLLKALSLSASFGLSAASPKAGQT